MAKYHGVTHFVFIVINCFFRKFVWLGLIGHAHAHSTRENECFMNLSNGYSRQKFARRVTFFSKMAFGECRRVWQVRATRLGECRRAWRVLATRLGKCRRVWRVLAKVDIFWRVLEFAKFAREWPLLIYDASI